jgi:hypothetical protein
MRLASQQKEMVKQLEAMKEAYVKAKQEKEQEETGEVPFTLGGK